MAEYILNCPQCGESIEADDSFSGMEAECPHCACKIIVPERQKVVLKKANQAAGLFLRFCSGIKCMTRREFWTLKHSVIVGQSVIVVLLFIAVVFLLWHGVCHTFTDYNPAFGRKQGRSIEMV